MKEHHFSIDDAKKYGIEKAVLLYNLRFWLDKEYVDAVKGKHRAKVHEHNGNEYVWTFNSGSSFGCLFPYFSERSISRWLKELEEEGVVISGSFNKHGYDRTKWYTLFEYCISQNGEWISHNDVTIPDSNLNTPVIQGEATASQEKYDGITRIPLNEDGEPTSRGKTTKAKYPNSKEVFKLWGSAQKGDWLTNTTQRKRAQLLFNEKGVDSITNALNFYREHADDEFCPLITSPSDLYQKWDNLLKHRDRINKNL